MDEAKHDSEPIEASPAKASEEQTNGKKSLRKSYSLLHLANEIPDANIALTKQLGSGSFGVVYAGECFGSPGISFHHYLA